MKRVYTIKDIEQLAKDGQSLPADAILTPQAKDALASMTALGKSAAVSHKAVVGAKEYKVPEKEYKWVPGHDPKTPAEIEKFFFSPEITKLKKLIVDLGKRSYGKNYNDGNGGNFSVRVGDNIVLCTPTMISKGSMSIDDMCLVDMEGNQLAGNRKRTSEVLAHLAIMKRQPMAKACCHAHPPHATAFALAGKTPPRCVNPETEIFIGQVGLADYGTPGTQHMANAVGECGVKHDCVFMVNHGVMTWAGDIETAFWKMENVEAHCYTSMLAFQIGGPRHFSESDARELVKIRSSMGMVDQTGLKECRLCESADEFRPACVCNAKREPQKSAGYDCDAEKLVQKITQMIMAELKK